MRRRAHVLRENSRGRLPNEFVVFDTEAMPRSIGIGEEHEFRLAVAYYFNRRKKDYPNPSDKLRTKDPEELWWWIERHTSPKTKLYVFAHNIDYDVTVSKGLTFLKNMGYEVKKWFVEDSVYHIVFRGVDRTIVLADTFSLFPFSLKVIGKWAGIEKATMPDFEDSDEAWFEYCERDVQVLSQALHKYFDFLSANDLGNFAVTIAGQSFNAFRHRFMHTRIFIHNLEEVEKGEIESYYGGRVEAWYIGKVPETVWYVDVNSMYPYVMKENSYPVEYIGTIDKPSLVDLKKLCDRYCVVARIWIETQLPILPYRTSKTIFPVGRFIGWYSTPEILLALRKGCVVKCDVAYVYRKAILFDQYVDFFYNLKQKARHEGDKATYTLSKLFLNSLYGKFGQRTAELIEISNDDVSEDEVAEALVSMAAGRINYIRFMDKIYRKEKREPSYNSFIAIAAHVTSYARVHLWHLIETAGLSNVYYMDTDSLFVNDKGLRNLEYWLDEDKLGYLKIEKSSADVTILGAKAYIWEGERKIKGIPRGAVEKEPLKFEFDHFMKFRTKLRKGLLDRQIVEKKTRELSLDYDKGIVTETGKVIPLLVEEF